VVTQAGLLQFQRIGSQAELQLLRTVEIGPDVFQVVFEVSERKRHGRDLALFRNRRYPVVPASVALTMRAPQFWISKWISGPT
jgi:hypothetical protein